MHAMSMVEVKHQMRIVNMKFIRVLNGFDLNGWVILGLQMLTSEARTNYALKITVQCN